MASESPGSPTLPAPWLRFLTDLSGLLSSPVSLHCLGGFVLTACYGAPRTTADVDYISVVPLDQVTHLQDLGGPESKLARKYKVWLQYVGIVNCPAEYQQRLVELFPALFPNLRLFALDPYDLLLSKLERNSPKDREDVAYLASKVPLDPRVLRARYEKELRPFLFNESRHDGTLEMWIEACFPAQD